MSDFDLPLAQGVSKPNPYSCVPSVSDAAAEEPEKGQTDVKPDKEDEKENSEKETVEKNGDEPKHGEKAEEKKEEISTNKIDCDKERDLSRKKVKRSKILLKAHRLILASCSPLIRKILDNNISCSSLDNLTIFFPGM